MLVGADLGGAMLGKANPSGAKLGKANLSGAKLGKANLTDAMLVEANLATTKGLTQQQLDSAQGNDHTELPAGLQRPSHWSAAG
jgi:uncharacterized protein YjbI with pentapeptide repeats